MTEGPKIRLLEELAANAWLPEIESNLDGWRLRFNYGIHRRCNSVLPIVDNKDIDIEKKINLAEEFYLKWGANPKFQLNPAVKPRNLAKLLIARGYSMDAYTKIKTASSNKVFKNTERNMNLEIISEKKLFPDWLTTFFKNENINGISAKMREGTLRRIGPKTNFVLVLFNGNPISVGLGVSERNWTGIYCMATSKKYRKLGGGTTVINSLANWAVNQNSENMYLQVMDDNPIANSLYEKVGFSTLYHYYFAEKNR
jgi:N-acetylglutamate synthase